MRTDSRKENIVKQRGEINTPAASKYSSGLRLETGSENVIFSRGRLLYVDDISRLLGGRKTDWWVRHHFAPSHKRKIGRSCAWFERDALEWIDEQRSGL
jgi:hypothetical protein